MISREKFDENYYLKKYSDVLKSGMDAWEHYINHGKKEGRFYCLDDEINRTFDAKFYLNAYPDVANDKINPLIHYKLYGRKEGRLSYVNYKDLKIINNSSFFDREWYVKYYFNVRNSNIDPAVDYLVNGRTGNRNPGPCFNSREYLMMHPDVKAHHMNPLIHYEKFGKYEKRKVQLCDIKEVLFPPDAEEYSCKTMDRKSRKKHIVSVFATFFDDGIISDYVVYLLKALRDISDFIILVSDNPVYKKEIEKIDCLVNMSIFSRHEEYDFGSYKRGYQWLMQNGILEDEDNLLFLNDSCFGPVNSFMDVIKDFEYVQSDFYGLSLAKFPIPYIQSFFYVFRPCVYNSNIFKEFVYGIKKELSSAHVIFNYEFKFTEILQGAGFTFSTFVPKNAFALDENKLAVVPTKFTKTLLVKYNYPLVKIKVMQGSTGEPTSEILTYIEKENPALAEIIRDFIEKKGDFVTNASTLNKYNLYECYKTKIQRCIQNKKRVQVIFLVSMSSMFSAENLMMQLYNDARFSVKLYIIPDVRFGEKEMFDQLSDTFIEMRKKYNFTQMAVEVRNEKIVSYKDVVKFADLICYSSPYDLSFSLYNPPYAARLGIPSIHINYGFFRSKYDRIIYSMDNYNNFWKVFLETPNNYEEYQKYGYCNARNAVLTGYSKMDTINNYLEKKIFQPRKKVILAPHHSVSGGTNKMLSLSNFEKYAELFLRLPKEYPDIDFVFRPHPVLFKVLRRKNMWGDKKVEDYIYQMKINDNVIYSTESDYLKLFAESDGIIQDCGSFLVEYMYTNKPCCYMLHSAEDIEEKFTQLGRDCLDNCYIAYQETDIRHFLDHVIIKNEDYKRDKRHQFAREKIMINYPNATKKIYEYLTTCFFDIQNTLNISADTFKEAKIEKLCDREKSEQSKKKIRNLQQENHKLEKMYYECYHELEELRKLQIELKELYNVKVQELDSSVAKAEILEEQYAQVTHSASWRITAWLRWIYYKAFGKHYLKSKE